MKKIIIKYLEHIKKEYIILFLVTLFIYMPFISMNFALGHDAVFHLTNVDAVTRMIINLNFSKITPYLANDFGYGTLIFYPPLPHLITAFFNIPFLIIGKSTIYSFKIVYFLTTLLSGYYMYKLSYLLTRNKNASLLSSVVYITMPYYLCDIFTRTAYNEVFIFLFMPMIFIGLISLLKDNLKLFYIYFLLGYFGIINSHLVLSVYFTILVLLFMISNLKSFLKKWKHLLLASVILLILIMPDIALLIQHKNLGIYTIFEGEYVSSTSDVVKTLGLAIKDYIIPRINKWDLYHYINIISIVFSILGIARVYNAKNKNKKIYIGFIIFLIFGFTLSLKIFPYQYLPKLLMSIQFAYRNEGFVIFALSIFAGYGLLAINKKYYAKTVYISIVVLAICSAPFINKMNLIRDNYYEDYGRVSGMGAHQEYLPLNGYKNVDYFIEREDGIIVTNNTNPKIKIIKNNSPELIFSVTNTNNATTTLELPRIYYLGYEILEEHNSKIKKLDYMLGDKGFIKINVKNNSKIYVKFQGTSLYNALKTIRNIIILLFLIMILTNKKIGWFKYEERNKKIKL